MMYSMEVDKAHEEHDTGFWKSGDDMFLLKLTIINTTHMSAIYHPYVSHIPHICHPYTPICHPYTTYMSPIYHPYVTHIPPICQPYTTNMSPIYIHMSPIYHPYVTHIHPYVTMLNNACKMFNVITYISNYLPLNHVIIFKL